MDKIISFGAGIRRQPSIGVEGELSELVNLVPKNGELVNVKPMVKTNIKWDRGNLVHVHSASGKKNYVTINALDGGGYQLSYVRYDDGNKDEGIIMNLSSEPNSITSVGNVLVVSGENGLEYALWKDKKYNRARINDLGFDIRITGQTVQTDKSEVTAALNREEFPWYIGMTSYYCNATQMEILYNRVDSLVNECIGKTEKPRNSFKYVSLGIAVLKMFDDSYVACSNIFTLDPMTSKHGMNAELFYSSDDNGLAVRVYPSLQSYNIEIKSPNITETEEELIKSVDVYLSRPTPFINVSEGFEYELTKELFNVKSKNAIEEEIANMVFYKSFSVDVGKLKQGDIVSPTTITGSEEELRLSDIVSYTYCSPTMFTYNSRLHIAGIESKLVDMNNVSLSQVSRQSEGGNNSNRGYYNKVSDAYDYTGATTSFDPDLKVKAVIEVDVNDPNTGFSTNRMYSESLQYPLPPILSYPSMYATEMRIYLIRSGSTVCFNSFKMRPHNYGNVSFSANTDTLGLGYTQAYERGFNISGTGLTSSLVWSLYHGDFNELVAKTNEQEAIEVRSNILKYSPSGNPFVFPSMNTVSVGDNSILGLSTSAKAVSQGQFGQFPLYAFCTDGIWTLEVASDGSYSARQPISRDVCVNPDSITQIDGAVVFVTDQGLKLIEGSNVVLMSGKMDGHNVDERTYFKERFFSSKGEEYKVYDDLIVPENRDFRNILKDCLIAYDYPNAMLRIFPKDYKGKYYVYSFAMQEFGSVVEFTDGKVDKTAISAVVHDYPTSLIQKGTNIYTFENTSEDNPLRCGLLLTRPIDFGEPFALKKLHDMKMHYSKHSEDTKCKVVVYVSNDKENWFVLPSLRLRAFKYFRIAIITKMTDADSLSGMAVRYDLERTNKLR